MTTEDFSSVPPVSERSPSLEERPGSQLQSELDSDFSMLYDSWVILRRRRYWALITLGMSIAAAIILAKVQAPEFDSTSTIRILESNGTEIQLGDTPATQLLGGNQETKLQTEMSVLTSRSLEQHVADVLDLYSNTTFSKPEKTEGVPGPTNPKSVYRIIKKMDKAISVEVIPHTEVISIRVRTHSPELSERIANTLVDQYVERGYQLRFKSQEGISDWLAKQLDDLRKQTETAQSRALEYGKKLDLLNTAIVTPTTNNGNGGRQEAPESLSIQRLLGLQQALTTAESDKLIKEAQYHVLQGSDLTAIPEGMSPVLTGLLTARANALAQVQQLSLKFGPNYSHLKELKAQIDQLNQQIDSELVNAQKRALAELRAANDAMDAIQNAVDREKRTMQQKDGDLIQYTIAQRDFESSYALYQGLLQKLKEAGVLAGLRANDVEIVDRALAPIIKSAPRTSLYLLVGVGGGAVLGILFALLLDSLDTSILDINVMEQATGVPSVGMIPKMRSGPITLQSMKQSEDHDSATRQQIESYWTLRTSLLLSHAGEPPRTIAITSAIPDEGKSTTAINLAVILAQGSDRVLLVECDLRRPSFGRRLGIVGAGLSQCLAGIKSPSECIHSLDAQKNLDVMPAGVKPPNPAELLGSSQFKDLLAQLRSKYRFVVIDAPPVASVSDIQIIALHVDGVLFVVRSGSTSRHIVHRSCRMLRQTGARLLGAVLNGIDYRSDTYGYYGYYKYYTTKLGDSEQKEDEKDDSK
jgi:polysaccharide biosynthesis transport protein